MISEVIPPATPATPENLRRLRFNELVKRGDFVEDGRAGFEPWVGPSGFHADSFVKTIYRKLTRRSKAAKRAA